MGFFDNIFGSKNGKERTTRAAANRRSGASSSSAKTAAGKKRKEEALKKAAETRKKPRKSLPGSATGPKKKTQAERDASLRTNRQKAKAPAKAPAKPKSPPVKSVKGDRPKFGRGNNKTISAKRNGKTVQLANVSAEQLKKTGLSLSQYMNQWNKTGKRPS